MQSLHNPIPHKTARKSRRYRRRWQLFLVLVLLLPVSLVGGAWASLGRQPSGVPLTIGTPERGVIFLRRSRPLEMQSINRGRPLIHWKDGLLVVVTDDNSYTLGWYGERYE